MDPAQRVVTRIPMDELWTAGGALIATRGRWLSEPAMRSLLREGPVRFVVANVGDKLVWIAPNECFSFWKLDVKPHLANTPNIHLEEFPGEWAYVASEWLDGNEGLIVLLERYH